MQKGALGYYFLCTLFYNVFIMYFIGPKVYTRIRKREIIFLENYLFKKPENGIVLGAKKYRPAKAKKLCFSGYL